MKRYWLKNVFFLFGGIELNLFLIIAAVFLDSDLDTVSSILCRIFWDDLELKSVWNDLPLHPIQAQHPDGDRHLISTTKILQHVQKFEDMIGVEFTHIRLLAQAFCTRSASFNLITLYVNIILFLSYL